KLSVRSRTFASGIPPSQPGGTVYGLAVRGVGRENVPCARVGAPVGRGVRPLRRHVRARTVRAETGGVRPRAVPGQVGGRGVGDKEPGTGAEELLHPRTRGVLATG